MARRVRIRDGMVRVQSEHHRKIALLQALIASERTLLKHPVYAVPAARLIAQARRELAILRLEEWSRIG